MRRCHKATEQGPGDRAKEKEKVQEDAVVRAKTPILRVKAAPAPVEATAAAGVKGKVKVKATGRARTTGKARAKTNK